MWDVHDKPVGGDASADGNKRCMSLQETFNPYKVNLQVGSDVGFNIRLVILVIKHTRKLYSNNLI